MKKIKSLIVLFVGILFLTACQDNTPAATTNEAGETVVQEMSGEELNKILEDNKQKENYLVIDVRPEEQYLEGTVKHAINIPLAEIENQLDRIEGYKESAVVTICNTGRQSQEAAEKLVELGFTNVSNAEGVKDFDYGVATTIGSILASDLQAIADEESDDYFIIDARAPEDYQAGHLKNAVNITKDTVADSLDQVPQDKTIVAYCYSGNQSYEVLNVLSENGHDNLWNSLDGTNEYEDFELVQE